jgi:transglutaminase-like putative cysteine protease
MAAGAMKDFTSLDSLRVRVLSTSPAARAFAQESRRGDIITTVRPMASGVSAGYTLPLDPGTRQARGYALRAEAGLDLDDPSIIRLAERLRGGEHDPTRVVRRLLAWVHDSIRADVPTSPRSAARTLKERQGDCGEHARLFVALARAAGIPARGAAGLLYVGGKFYYHAWAEVYLGPRFLAVDPMLGQLPVDAAHLRAMSGSLELQTELMLAMARLELKVEGMVPPESRQLTANARR